MNEETSKNLSREERLAAKLRENLKRRKAQSKAILRAAEGDSPVEETLSKPADGS